MGTAAVCIGTGRLCRGREKAFLYFYDVQTGVHAEICPMRRDWGFCLKQAIWRISMGERS